jgi:hypothetical protein
MNAVVSAATSGQRRGAVSRSEAKARWCSRGAPTTKTASTAVSGSPTFAKWSSFSSCTISQRAPQSVRPYRISGGASTYSNGTMTTPAAQQAR